MIPCGRSPSGAPHIQNSSDVSDLTDTLSPLLSLGWCFLHWLIKQQIQRRKHFAKKFMIIGLHSFKGFFLPLFSVTDDNVS